MNLTLRVWRQQSRDTPGRLESYQATDVNPDMSFLEMLDVLNEKLTLSGARPIAFDHDCREGICGSCGVMINGVAHGPERATATCQLHMRHFSDGDEIVVEPWRARAFPVVSDLAVDRSALDRIIQAGGYIGVSTGGTPDGNAIPVGKTAADDAMDAAACIGCGACVAACPNASASLFTAAKITHLGLLPQGQPERNRRALSMVSQMDLEQFGSCSLYGECQEACPKEISIDTIARMNRDFVRATVGSDHGERAAPRPTVPAIPPPRPESFADSETALGGADAAEKTSYVTGQGTDPNTVKREGVPPVGRAASSALVWVAAGVAAVIAAIYLIGMFR